VLVEQAVREAADHADVAASRLRGALVVLFERLAAGGVGAERLGVDGGERRGLDARGARTCRKVRGIK
jgi:hypothetical protein